MNTREQWGSHRGFILATIGASVGLGNIWRFSYVAGENGGATFLLLYLFFVLLIGLPLVIAELALGRRSQGDAISAFSSENGSERWQLIGWVGAVGALLILSYYAVIAGWAAKYFTGAVTGSLWTQASDGYGVYFGAFIADGGEPVGWQALMLLATLFIVAGGIKKGIERANSLLMPILAVLIVALAAFALSLPNAMGGVNFLFTPDWSVLAKPSVYVAALGQAFFSLGIGMAVFLTYGSYMPRSFSLSKSAVAIAFGDSLFAIIAGLAIFPAVFAFGVDPTAGPELAFITLPQVFLNMPGGVVIGAVFFLLLSLAALTSMVALLEVPVSILTHRFHMRRWNATAVTGIVVFLLGLPSAMSFGVLRHFTIAGQGILDAVDSGVSNFILPVSGILLAVFAGWRLSAAVALLEADLTESAIGPLWRGLLRYCVPFTIVAILLQSASTL